MENGQKIKPELFSKVLCLLLGVILGFVGGQRWLSGETPIASVAELNSDQEQPPKLDSARCETELAAARERIQALSRQLSDVKTAATAADQHAAPPEGEGEPTQLGVKGDETVTWRVSAVEKFVPLTNEQRARLRSKFIQERVAGNESTEKLEDIIGAENAAFYRQQVQAAFERSRQESLQREVVWIAHQLTLSKVEEDKVRGIFLAVEQQLIEEGRAAQGEGKSPQQRLQAVLQENRRRDELRNEQLKQLLSAEQFEQFLKQQAQSSDADVEIFHGGG